eukprot:1495026-Rhodomonas_salina.1
MLVGAIRVQRAHVPDHEATCEVTCLPITLRPSYTLTPIILRNAMRCSLSSYAAPCPTILYLPWTPYDPCYTPSALTPPACSARVIMSADAGTSVGRYPASTAVSRYATPLSPYANPTHGPRLKAFDFGARCASECSSTVRCSAERGAAILLRVLCNTRIVRGEYEEHQSTCLLAPVE